MNALYTRLLATGYDAEIKRGHVGWRFYLLDPKGQRVSLGKSLEELPRTGSESVASVNARLKGARGFRKDSRFHAVLTAMVEYCEKAAADAHPIHIEVQPDGSVAARTEAPMNAFHVARFFRAVEAAKNGGAQ